MTAPSSRRRLELALSGIVISACLLRTQLADALVVRGDGCLYRARPSLALQYYRRALWLDANDGTAVDRFVFVAMTLREGGALRDGIAVASRYLERNPDDDVVRMDRAMAYRATGRPAQAVTDFATVGRRTKDARALTFAGFAAEEIGQRDRARAFWHSAVAIDPGFPAAQHALTRSGSP
ncbi:MAG: hypothetical protein ABI231_08455 [Candidatus Tumulicola sp.]